MLDITKFQYCPRCGQPELRPNNAKSFVCGACGFVYYHSVAAAVVAIIEYEGKIILTRRTIAPHKGALALPGGFVDYGESLEDALLREMQEELNITVSAPVYFCSGGERYDSHDVLYFCSPVFFLVRVSDISSMTARDDIDAFMLLAPDEIDLAQVAFEMDRVAIERYVSFTGSRK